MGNQYMRRQPTIFWVLAPIVSLLLFRIADEFNLSYGIRISDQYIGIMNSVRDFLLLLFGVCTVGSVIVFIIDVWNNEELLGGGKIGWILLLILGSILIFPIYYHCFLRDRYNMTPERTRKEVLILTLIAVGMMAIYLVWSFTSLVMFIYEYDFLWIVHYVWYVYAILINVFVILVYIFLVCSNNNIRLVKKILWIPGVVILGIVFWPLYLWLHMYKNIKG